MPDSQQLPLFDFPGDGSEPAAPKHARKPKAPRHEPAESAETLPMLTDLTPTIAPKIESVKTGSAKAEQPKAVPPKPKLAPAPAPIEAAPEKPPLNLKYPSYAKLVPTILNADSLDVLEWLAPRVIDADDAPHAASELIDVLGVMGTQDAAFAHNNTQRANAALMLGMLHQPVDIELLVARIWADSPEVSRAIAAALGEIGTWVESSFDDLERLVHGLIVALRHPDAQTRITAARSLGKMRAVAAVPDMIARLELETDPDVNDVLVMVLSDFGSAEAIEGILNAFDADLLPYDLVCKAMLRAGSAAAETLLAVISGWNERIASRALAADVLALQQVEEAIPALIAILERPYEHEVLRGSVARALGTLAGPDALPALQAVLDEQPTPGHYVTRAVNETLSRLAT